MCVRASVQVNFVWIPSKTKIIIYGNIWPVNASIYVCVLYKKAIQTNQLTERKRGKQTNLRYETKAKRME